jgi:MurNAc alpha-1-phosphate uridylyltransferase
MGATKTAMILAAGRGERMRPLTDHCPKPLLTIAGKALIEYHLGALKQAGYQRVVINHAWLGQQIVDLIGSGNRYGLKVLYSAESSALETAGGIVQALPLLCQTPDESSFTVVNGDVFTNFDFSDLPADIPVEQGHLVMVNNPEHNPNGDFCLVGKQLIDDAQNKLTFSGIACYHKAFFKPLAIAKQPLAPLLKSAIRLSKISAQHFKGQWTDVGTPQRLAQLNSQSIELQNGK